MKINKYHFRYVSLLQKIGLSSLCGIMGFNFGFERGKRTALSNGWW